MLVGRAKHQAGALSAELRKRGAEVLEIPFIEIRKPKSFKPLDAALKSLGTYDWLILTSVNGVEAMWERMSKLRLNKTLCSPMLRIAAIGPATKKAIEQRGDESRRRPQGIRSRIRRREPEEAKSKESACCWSAPKSPAT